MKMIFSVPSSMMYTSIVNQKKFVPVTSSIWIQYHAILKPSQIPAKGSREDFMRKGGTLDKRFTATFATNGIVDVLITHNLFFFTLD
jgi:hypothetical protein